MTTDFFDRASAALRLTVLALAVAAIGFAQMDGGMMGPGSSGPSGQSMGNGTGMGSGMGMGSREMMDGPAVGPDGTAYVVRRVPTTSSSQQQMSPSSTGFKNELVAVNVRDGSAKWKLEITGGMVSDPALAKDGKIFFTASEFGMTGQGQSGGMMDSGNSASEKARLIIVTTDLVSARITKTVEVDADVLSAPKIATDETGNYVVYVVGFEMGFMGAGDNRDASAGEKNLFAFTPDGQLKFKVKLSEAQVGIPPR